MKLNSGDYNKILNHYNKRIPKTLKNRKDRAEKLLAKKMCSCIKKVKIKTKKKSPSLEKSGKIAICTKSIFKNRGLKYNRISCKRGARLISNKRTGKRLTKTRRIIF